MAIFTAYISLEDAKAAAAEFTDINLKNTPASANLSNLSLYGDIPQIIEKLEKKFGVTIKRDYDDSATLAYFVGEWRLVNPDYSASPSSTAVDDDDDWGVLKHEDDGKMLE